MASCFCVHNIITSIFLTITLLSFVSVSTPSTLIKESAVDDFNRWVSWNVDKYNNKIYSHAISPDANVDDPRSRLDMRLVKAESMAMKYIVNQDGSGDYTSIREAIDNIPIKNTRRIILDIAPGIYREKLVIPKSMSFITFLGDATNPPIITGNDTASTKAPNGIAYKTYHSATLAVNSNYFIAKNIIFKNNAPSPYVGQMGGQAVSVRISGDKAAFYNCSFYGEQDTLYDHRGLHYFKNCFIQGSIDFIFGYGKSLYENCYLNSVSKKVASLTAQKRSASTMDSGFSFVRSTISGSGLLYLGRAWGDHSRVVFSYTYMDRVVIPQGWNSWRVQQPEHSGLYYGEYDCIGPGANSTGRVHWARLLTDEEAKPFLGTYYIDGDSWILGQTSN